MEEFVDAIDEQIEDDNKVVTYKSLSFSLALPMQKSKEVLTEYFQAKKDLNACYLLTGKTKSGIQIKLVNFDKLEEEKEKFERLISSHIYSVQKTKLKTSADLYNADYDAIKAATQSNQRYGVISYAGSKQLTADEIAKGREKMQANRGKKEETLHQSQSFPKSTTKTKTPTQKKNAFALFTPKTTSSKNKEAEENKVKKEVKETEEDEESSNATETASNEKAKPKEKVGSKSSESSSSSTGKKKKASTSNMMKFMSKDKTDPFAAAATSQKSSSSVKKEKPESAQKKTKKKTTTDEEEEVDFLDDVLANLSNTKSPPKARTGRGMLFMDDSDDEEEEVEVRKNSQRNKKDSPKKEQVKISSPKKEKKKELKVDSPKKKKASEPVKRKKKQQQVSDDSDDEMSISINQIKKNSKKGGSQSVKKSTKKKSKKEEKKPAAKRSRIVTNSSSESEDEEENMSAEEEPEAATPVKPRGPVIKVGEKCKKRVLKSRTYVDEDGSMLTEKVYEEVSCSDGDDDENKDVVPATPEPVKKKTIQFAKPPANKKSKQSSLKSFFTKK